MAAMTSGENHLLNCILAQIVTILGLFHFHLQLNSLERRWSNNIENLLLFAHFVVKAANVLISRCSLVENSTCSTIFHNTAAARLQVQQVFFSQDIVE